MSLFQTMMAIFVVIGPIMMKQGFRYVWSRKILLTLGGGFMAAGFAMGLIQPFAVFLVTERLGMKESDLQ
ncbi:hypothetical protein [Geobacillus subterraneus]|uniref:hypothetical protein n=1 Tax=Geobacillus subterraneus TaxID=129338 RepID=UPI001816DAF9